MFIVIVVCVREAHEVRLVRLVRLRPCDLIHILLGRAEGRRLVPQDEVVPLAAQDVVGAVPVMAHVHDRASLDVLMTVQEIALPPAPTQPTESQPRACELLAQAYVERHVACIRMHVKPEILPVHVLHHEGVVMVQMLAFYWKKRRGECPHVMALQRVDRLLHPNRVEHHAIPVHRIGTHHGQSGRLVMLQLAQ